jgi:hypothetical protein
MGDVKQDDVPESAGLDLETADERSINHIISQLKNSLTVYHAPAHEAFMSSRRSSAIGWRFSGICTAVLLS